MKFLLCYFLFTSSLLYSFKTYGQSTKSETQESIITPEDLKLILGNWTGTLTYLDYSSNKPFSMPADLIISQGKDEYQLVLENIYPREPKANGKDKIKISKDGKQINKKNIKSRQKLSENQIQITTEYEGNDNNNPALIRNIYILDSSEFLIQKEVKFSDSEKWLKRSEFSYNR